MASTNKTANYELSQYIGTDIPNPLTDYNSDMEKIDTALAGIATIAGEAKEDSEGATTVIGEGTLYTEAQTLIGAVNELKNEDDGLKSRVGTVETGLNSVNNSLATTNQALTNTNNRVGALETKVGNEVLNTSAQTVTGAINELKAVDDSLDGRVSALEAGGGGGGGTIDTEMSGTSTNAVQNKVIKGYVDDTASTLSTAISNAKGEEQHTTIAIGGTSATLTFETTIGSTSHIDVSTDDYTIVPTNVTYTEHTVTITITEQIKAVGISVVVVNF